MKKVSSHPGIVILYLAIVVLTCFIVGIHAECLGMGGTPVSTATLIDEETGKPIEGAVALAIWRKTSSTEGAWFEGGKFEVLRIVEEVSDSNGNIYISGFWNWHLENERYPHLTIYKRGYVCWDQGSIYIDELHRIKRTDFDKGHRIVRMRKWPEGFSFIGHERFVNSVTFGDHSEAPKRLFNKEFHNEIPFASKERDERNQKRKEMDEEQKRRDMQ